MLMCNKMAIVYIKHNIDTKIFKDENISRVNFATFALICERYCGCGP